MKIRWICSLALVSLLASSCDAVDAARVETTPRKPEAASAASTTRTHAAAAQPKNVEAPGQQPFRVVPELRDAVVRATAAVDADGDGRITKQEASGALDFVVGGFLFRADSDGNGKITPDERKQARADFAKEHPDVERLLMSFADTQPVKTLMAHIDEVVPKTIDAKAARATIRASVEQAFGAVDEDGDGAITRPEADEALNVAASALGKAAFRAGDHDHDGAMTFAEFEASMKPPLRRIFDYADSNDDGKLSEAEAAGMMAWAAQRLDAIGAAGFSFASMFVDTSSASAAN